MPRRNLIAILLVAIASLLCYQRAARNRYAAILGDAINTVSTHYINDVEPRVLFEGAMKGMIDQLDPYSAYTSPEDYQQFQQQLEGEFTGVGIVIEQDSEHSRLNVVEALIGKPAYLAGIRAGDAILAVDGIETAKVPLTESAKRIRGKEGTSVNLRVLPLSGGEPVEHELVRAAIPLETVLGDARDQHGQWIYRLANHPRLGYIRIFDNFGERTAEEFRSALASYRRADQAIDGLILDLRYNRGGLLQAANEVCDMLLDDGVIVTTRGRHGSLVKEYRATPGTELPLNVPIVVLVDRLSASASEIMAAALQDNGRAEIAGQRSWGKASVQNVIRLEGGRSALRLTVGSYHRPSGKEIHKWKGAADSDDWGVRPDFGLEELLTNAQNELVIQARRKRDFLPWAEVSHAIDEKLPDENAVGQSASTSAPKGDGSATASDLPPVPIADQEPDGQAASDPPSLDRDAIAAARQDPVVVDPQLRKAVKRLQQNIQQQKPHSKRA